MLIRNPRDDDWQACLELDQSYETEMAWQMDEHQAGGEWQVAFREIHLPRKLQIQPATLDQNQIKSWQNRDKFWVAVEHRQVIGYIGLDIDPGRDQAQVTDIAVAPDFRRRGIGTHLLQRAIEWCVRQHITQLVLVCPLKAHPGISFALKHRFAFCGFQDAYWPGQEVALFFRQRIR